MDQTQARTCSRQVKGSRYNQEANPELRVTTPLGKACLSVSDTSDGPSWLPMAKHRREAKTKTGPQPPPSRPAELPKIGPAPSSRCVSLGPQAQEKLRPLCCTPRTRRRPAWHKCRLPAGQAFGTGKWTWMYPTNPWLTLEREH